MVLVRYTTALLLNYLVLYCDGAGALGRSQHGVRHPWYDTTITIAIAINTSHQDSRTWRKKLIATVVLDDNLQCVAQRTQFGKHDTASI